MDWAGRRTMGPTSLSGVALCRGAAGGLAWRLCPGFGRAIALLVAVLVCTQPLVASAGAVAPGKNGLLLLAAPEGTTYAGANAAPAARVADCSEGLPNELWTVRPGGGGVAAVGRGDVGQFSPDGRLLLSSFSPGCYSGNELSLSRSPFHREHPIRGANFIDGESDASFGPWLGPGSPTFLDPNGTFRAGTTGRALVRDTSAAALNNSAAAMSCSGRVANADGTIGTPVRASGHVIVRWRRIPGRQWLGNEHLTGVQWSPDGRYAYFTTWSRRSDRLWRVDADGGGRRLLFSDPASDDLLTQLSPNGRWILIKALDGSFGERLSVITAKGRRLHTVTHLFAGGNLSTSAEWSPRGDLLLVWGEVSYYAIPPYPVTSFEYVVHPGGGPPHYLSLPKYLSAQGQVWSPDERFIAYATSDATTGSQTAFLPEKFVIYPVATGPARTVLTASVPVDPYNQGYLTVADWQASPGSARPIRCADGRAPF
jgi:hypothetical protein